MDLTGSKLYELIKAEATKEVKNIHQDTWTFEEGEPSQDVYKNQLTKSVYRMGSKENGEVTVNWTIGQYDYALKAEFLGGTVVTNAAGNAVGWKRARGAVEIQKCIIGLTEDEQYFALPLCNIASNEANADGALGLAIKGTMMEPENEAIMPEYWFDAEEVVAEG